MMKCLPLLQAIPCTYLGSKRYNYNPPGAKYANFKMFSHGWNLNKRWGHANILASF